jgi:hypothetical protein
MPDNPSLYVDAKYDASGVDSGIQKTADTVSSATGQMKGVFASLSDTFRAQSEQSNRAFASISEAVNRLQASISSLNSEGGSAASSFASKAEAASRSIGNSFTADSMQVRLLTQEFGLNMPRALNALIARMPEVSGVIRSAFPVIAAIGFTEVIYKAAEAVNKFWNENVALDSAFKAAAASEQRMESNIESMEKSIQAADVEVLKLSGDLIGALTLKGAQFATRGLDLEKFLNPDQLKEMKALSEDARVSLSHLFSQIWADEAQGRLDEVKARLKALEAGVNSTAVQAAASASKIVGAFSAPAGLVITGITEKAVNEMRVQIGLLTTLQADLTTAMRQSATEQDLIARQKLSESEKENEALARAQERAEKEAQSTLEKAEREQNAVMEAALVRRNELYEQEEKQAKEAQEIVAQGILDQDKWEEVAAAAREKATKKEIEDIKKRTDALRDAQEAEIDIIRERGRTQEQGIVGAKPAALPDLLGTAQVKQDDQLRALNARLEAEELRHVTAMIQIDALQNNLPKLEADMAKRAQIIEEYNRKLEALNRKETQDYQEQWHNSQQIVNQGFINGLNNWIATNQKFSISLRQMLVQLIEAWADYWAKKLLLDAENWIISKILGKTSSTSAAAGQIQTNAAVAASGAIAATEPIPFVGPELAPAAGASAYAEVMALVAGIFSSEKGGVFPAGGLSILHPNEMVLPSPISKTIQSMTNNYGSGGSRDMTFHNTNNFHGLGDDAFSGMLAKGGTTMVKAVSKKLRQMNRIS